MLLFILFLECYICLLLETVRLISNWIFFRKYYTYQPEMSKFRDEYSVNITVPNIPLW